MLARHRGHKNLPPMVYHATEWGEEIITDRHIQANSTVDLSSRHSKATDLRLDEQHHSAKGICLTRSFHFAKLFSPVIFGLDLAKIRHRHRLVQRAENGAYDLADDHGDYRIEAEEFAICSGLDLKRHLIGIWISAEYRNDPSYQPIIQDPRFLGFFK